MLHFRQFRNTDPPTIVEIWRSRAPRLQSPDPISVESFEQVVFGKPYFDPAGLFLAFDDDTPVGFAHAGFGPAKGGDELQSTEGVICVVVVRPDCNEFAVARGLVEQCEAYLRDHGAQHITGGGVRPCAPFYIGLYGESEPPGVLDTDTVMMRTLDEAGFAQVDRTQQYALDLSTFRPIMNAKILQLRRDFQVEIMHDAPARNWWEACTIGGYELTRLALRDVKAEKTLAMATLRGMEPVMLGAPPSRVRGLMDVRVAPSRRREGIATFMLNEAFRDAARQGVVSILAQANETDLAMQALYRAFGMQRVSCGHVFRKDVN